LVKGPVFGGWSFLFVWSLKHQLVPVSFAQVDMFLSKDVVLKISNTSVAKQGLSSYLPKQKGP
jgi:hypothetical protein